MACEKAGTASFLGYPVILLLLQRYSITASFVKTVISFLATNTRIACNYMASRSVALVCRVNNKSEPHRKPVHNPFVYKLLLLYKYR